MMLVKFSGDARYSGNGTISGTVSVDGVPASGFRVLLMESNRCVREQITDISGYYEFKKLNHTLRYDVIVRDVNNLWEAKISTNRQPAV